MATSSSMMTRLDGMSDVPGASGLPSADPVGDVVAVSKPESNRAVEGGTGTPRDCEESGDRLPPEAESTSTGTCWTSMPHPARYTVRSFANALFSPACSATLRPLRAKSAKRFRSLIVGSCPATASNRTFRRPYSVFGSPASGGAFGRAAGSIAWSAHDRVVASGWV